jgi:hypothetical protein
MAIILIVEEDERARRALKKLDTPHELVCVASAEKAWSLVEAGFTFDEVIYFADPIAETLLQAAAIDHEAERCESDRLAIELVETDWVSWAA